MSTTGHTAAPGHLATALPTRLALGDALDDLAERDRLTPCQRDPEPFTSEHRAERDGAARPCLAACPVVDFSRAYAEAADEPWHVWGGVDRTTRGRSVAGGVPA